MRVANPPTSLLNSGRLGGDVHPLYYTIGEQCVPLYPSGTSPTVYIPPHSPATSADVSGVDNPLTVHLPSRSCCRPQFATTQQIIFRYTDSGPNVETQITAKFEM